MALAVERHRADRAVFKIDVEPADLLRLHFLKLAAALGRREIFGRRLLQALLAGELVGARAAQHDVGAVLHHRAGDADRILRSEEHTSELQSLMSSPYAVI